MFAESTAPAVREMLSELGGLRERPITTEEHAKARATLLMRVAEGLSTTGGIAATFGELGLYGLPLDEPMRFVAALERTTADDLRALADRYVDPGRGLHRHRRRSRGDRARPARARPARRPVLCDADGDRRVLSRPSARRPRSSRRFFSFWRARSRRVPTVERGIVSLSAISS